jgi:uncharacterized protein (TIGR03435 family)
LDRTERFDVVATLPAGATPAQVPEMLQSLLAERFGLKIHKEKKGFPVYALVVGKSPLKLRRRRLKQTRNRKEW